MTTSLIIFTKREYEMGEYNGIVSYTSAQYQTHCLTNYNSLFNLWHIIFLQVNTKINIYKCLINIKLLYS